MYCDVVIPRAGNRIYTYLCDNTVQKGDIVSVPFGRGTARGLVLSIKEEEVLHEFEVKEIENIVFPEFSLRNWRFDVFEFLMKRYAAFPDEVALLFFPPGILERSKSECRAQKTENISDSLSGKRKEIFLYLRERYPRWIKKSTLVKYFGNISYIITELQKQGLIVCRDTLRTSRPRPFKFSYQMPETKQVSELTEDQMRVYKDVATCIDTKNHKTFLLFGVTGSGKTAVYYKLFEYILQNNKSGVFLVPEIALTVQTLSYFLDKFKDRVFVYHSGLSSSEKNWIARKSATSESVVIIGPRSSLFLPINNLSLIVIDEEHDFSYKEEERMPMYDTREVARFIGKKLNIPVLLGSGTPDVVTMYRAVSNKYRFHVLTERFKEYEDPEIQIIDMKAQSSGSIFSMALIGEINKSLSRGKGVILFINRRGYTPVVQCRDCGHIIHCPMCSVPLVVHRREMALKCHICGHTEDIPEVCPHCGSFNLSFGGYGTERIEEEIKRFFPNARIAILDRDTVQRKGMKEKIYSDFLSGKIDILIGTQMLSVGFDFPHVETVGVINADIGLGLPDYRSEERVAQTLFQVAGRLRKKGKVIVQTRQPDHPIFVYLKNHDYKAFFLYEIDNRKRYKYPPFINLIQIITRSQDENLAKETIFQMAYRLKDTFSRGSVTILGPSPPPYRKIRGEYRWQIVLKVNDTELDKVLNTLFEERKNIKDKKLKITINLNPLSML